MSKKIFVGGLSWDTTNDGFRQAFAQFGNIEDAIIITDRETGRSRGFGFITYSDQESVQKAVAEMDGKELDGRTIRVNEAEDKPRDRGGDDYGRGGGGRRNSGRDQNRNNRW